MRLIDAEFEENHYASMLLNPTPDVTEQDKRKARVIIEALRMAKAVEPEPHWIPVEQELPKEETDVLVTVHFLGVKTQQNGWNNYIQESYYVDIASHICGEWSSASDEYKIAKDRHKVLAWMPLPEPYKEVTE